MQTHTWGGPCRERWWDPLRDSAFWVTIHGNGCRLGVWGEREGAGGSHPHPPEKRPHKHTFTVITLVASERTTSLSPERLGSGRQVSWAHGFGPGRFPVRQSWRVSNNRSVPCSVWSAEWLRDNQEPFQVGHGARGCEDVGVLNRALHRPCSQRPPHKAQGHLVSLLLDRP